MLFSPYSSPQVFLSFDKDRIPQDFLRESELAVMSLCDILLFYVDDTVCLRDSVCLRNCD